MYHDVDLHQNLLFLDLPIIANGNSKWKMWLCNVWANSVQVVNLSVVLGTGVSVSALKASLSFIVTSKWRGYYGGYDQLKLRNGQSRCILL